MLFSLLAIAAAAVPDSRPEIVVTASRLPQSASDTPASVSVIDSTIVERTGEPLASSLLRLTPSAAVETDGPAGSLTQVRIRGAEANHTLLFIDGIRANDPAAGDIPRFELLNADIVSRIEVVRGPQSALWGSDAIGGVVAVNGLPAERSSRSLSAEGGSFGFGRAAAAGALTGDAVNLAGAVGWQGATGIDSFDGTGDKDGFHNLAARARGSWQFAPEFEIGASGFSLSGRSEFDGFDPVTYIRADTLDSSRNQLSAGRLWLSGGSDEHGLSGTLSTSLLGSSNRNFLADSEINRTAGDRWSAGAQAQYRFDAGTFSNRLIVALDHDKESFRASDTIYGGATDQRRTRTHDAITGEWRSQAGPLVADIALRRDVFSAFQDATTLRASALVTLGSGFSLAGGYSEGIAQPTFFDLYGVFPGTFVGNPDLKPESSRGFEASLRYRRGTVAASLTGYRQRLHDEIIDLFDPATFLSSTVNRSEPSHRSGIEAELAWSPGDGLNIRANYAWLDATEPGAVPSLLVREVRRPRHSGSILADGHSGRFAYGWSIAYVGARDDTNFDVFPAEKVHLGAYWLAGARLAWAFHQGIEIFVRGSNLFDSRYQDVFGYRTEGRAVFAGVRLGGG